MSIANMQAGAVAIALVVFTYASPAPAQTPLEKPQPKEVRLLISHPPGGGYDAYARLLARHLGAHLPETPTVIPQNMPGAGGLVMADYMFSSAARDGSVIALGPGSIATAALLKVSGARYDAQRFTWLGSLNADVGIAVSWRTSKVKRASDLFSRVLIVGGAGSSDQSVVYPNALDKILGTRFKVIPGYRGSAAIALALERGEVMGVGGWNYSSVVAAHSNWLKDGKLNLLLQFAIHPHPALTDVPTVFQLAHNDRERSVLKLVFSPSEMGRAVFAPPGIPPKARKLLPAFDLRRKQHLGSRLNRG